MPLVDLIYGPRRDVHSIRPTIVDMDTVRDMVSKAKQALDQIDLPHNAPAVVSYRKRGDRPDHGEVVSADDLDALSAFDRNTLMIDIQRGPAGANISFLWGVSNAIGARYDGWPDWGTQLKGDLESIILDNGQPIWRPRRFVHLLPPAGAAIFASLWIWLLAVTAPPLPAVILGWIVTVGVVVASFRWSNRLLQIERVRQVRHRIRTETRAATYARRIDARANLRVTLVTAALALPIGFILALLTNSFGLKG